MIADRLLATSAIGTSLREDFFLEDPLALAPPLPGVVILNLNIGDVYFGCEIDPSGGITEDHVSLDPNGNIQLSNTNFVGRLFHEMARTYSSTPTRV